MHPQGDFDADLRRLLQMERPDRVSGLLNSMHVTDTSARIRLRSRLVGSAERTIAAILSMARRGGRFASELASARKAYPLQSGAASNSRGRWRMAVAGGGILLAALLALQGSWLTGRLSNWPNSVLP